MVEHTLLSQRMQTGREFGRNTRIWEYLQKAFPGFKSEDSLDDPGIQKDFFEDHLDPAVPDDVGDDKQDSVPDPDTFPWDAVESEKIDRPDPHTPHRPVRPEKFFERLTCVRRDCERFEQLCRELRRIDYNTFRLSAAVLMRATFEWSLKYHLEKKGHWENFLARNQKPSYHDIARFCARKDLKLFVDDNYRRRLEQIANRDVLADCSMAAHSDAANVTPDRLIAIAGEIRPIIRYIAERANYTNSPA